MVHSSHCGTTGTVCLRVVPVKVYGKNNDQEIAYAIVDEGSIRPVDNLAAARSCILDQEDIAK